MPQLSRRQWFKKSDYAAPVTITDYRAEACELHAKLRSGAATERDLLVFITRNDLASAAWKQALDRLGPLSQPGGIYARR